MIARAGVQLYRDADALLARSAATFQRAAAEPLDPSAVVPSDPTDLVGAAVDVVTAGTLGRLGAMLVGQDQRLTASLIDVLA
ncbi:MAG: hypothetical protein U0807_17885 [Candidatus Binatia bacterium]